MKKLLLPMLVASALVVTGCCECTAGKNKDTAAGTDKSATNAGVAGAAAGALALGAFNWDAATKSSADLGSTPYFALPEGMVLVAGDEAATAANATKLINDGELNIYDGAQVSTNKGKLSYLDITAKEGAEFDQPAFDAHVTEYMKSIGAVEFYNDSVPVDTAKQLGELDGITNEDYMAGEFPERNLRQFAVNHDNGQLFYQVMSDEKHGEIGVLEVDGFSGSAVAQAEAPEAPAEEVKQEEAPAEEAKAEDAQPTASDMKAQLDESGKAILNINFDSSKSTIRSDNTQIVDQIYALLSENPDLKLSIEGHTDSSGNAGFNQKLSVARAEEVKSILEKKGIDASRLKATGFGPDKPIAANDTSENKAKNRRVELVKF